MHLKQKHAKNYDELKYYITSSQAIKGINSYYYWLTQVTEWINTMYADKGYAAEWLALTDVLAGFYWTGSDQIIRDDIDHAVDKRIEWLQKLIKVTNPTPTIAPTLNVSNKVSLKPSSNIILEGVRLFEALDVASGDYYLTSWIKSVNSWLEESGLGSEFLAAWNKLGNSPFMQHDHSLQDTPENWESYQKTVRKRYQWLADLISKSNTIEKQYRKLGEDDETVSQKKINFDGPGYELIRLLTETFKKTEGYTEYRLFAADEDIYEYAAFKFWVRGKDMTIKQLKKSVENKKNPG